MKNALKNEHNTTKVAEIALKQKKVSDKIFQKRCDEFDKLEMMLSNFDLKHLNCKDLFGFIPYIDIEIDIHKKNSGIYFTYTIVKTEEDCRNSVYQKFTFPLSTIEKYMKTKQIDMSEIRQFVIMMEKYMETKLTVMEDKHSWTKVAEMTLTQKNITDDILQKSYDESKKLDMMLSNFVLTHLNDNEITELFGFIPHIWFEDIDIIKKKSEIFLTYTICKYEEDYQNDNIQKITLPLSIIEKYIKTAECQIVNK